MKRKYLALLLILALVLCLFPVTALAAPGVRIAAARTLPTADTAAEVPETEAEDEAEAEDAAVPEEDADLPEEDAGALNSPEGDGDDPMPPDDPTPDELAAAAALAAQIEPDGEVQTGVVANTDGSAVTVGPDGIITADEGEDLVTVSAGEAFYAYEGMTVYNNGGTVYNNAGTVFNNAGTVFNNGGTVYNNAGTVYANTGLVYNNAGDIYTNGAEVFSFTEDAAVSSSRVYDYHELKFADYYEPFILVDGVFVEPGAESMLIGENMTCHISPYPGIILKAAETEAGTLIWDSEDGSLYLSHVDADTTLTLTLQADAPAFGMESGSFVSEQTVEISGPAGCKIYYSLDGSVPDAETGTLYEAPFQVAESCSIKAVAVIDGVETSDAAKLKLAFLSFTAPDFAEEKEGYFRPSAQAILVKNPGEADVKVTGVMLEGEDAEAFALSSEDGKTIPAGGLNDSKWTIRPVKGLSAGIYEAAAVFTLESGETVEVPLSFTVIADGEEAEADAETEDAEAEADNAEVHEEAETDAAPEEDVPAETDSADEEASEAPEAGI